MIQLSGARELAMISLGKSEKHGKYANIELNAMLKKYSLPANDRSLFTVLYYGTLERLFTLDYIIRKFSDIPFEEINMNIRNILRLSLYQLIFLDKIPDHAVCDQAVKLAAKYSNLGASGYVNAVLRQFLRSGFSLNDITDLSAKYSYNNWMIDLWTDAYGREKAIEIMEAQNTHLYLSLRVNTLKTTKKTLWDKLTSFGLTVEDSPLSSSALLIKNSPHVTSLPGFSDGEFFVQDAASQYAVELLKPESGSFVIDCCACPGGKSFSSAIEMKNKGRILSLDLHENKLNLIKNEAKTLGIDIISAEKQDATDPRMTCHSMTNHVICDVPCSGLGVISKKPDIRMKSSEDIKKLPELQYKILEKSSGYLTCGGTLLYSTCTLNPAENQDITNRFLSSHPQFERKNGFPKTIFPTEKNDGFFIDILVRNK